MEAMAPLLTFLICAILICNSVRGIRIKDTFKTIKTAAGDIFDCVDIYKQPAFDHPLLKDHKILMKPNVLFEDFTEESHDSNDNGSMLINLELEGGGCPKGTVPIHRLPENNHTAPSAMHLSAHQETDNDDSMRRLWAVRAGDPRNYYGASARFEVYGLFGQVGQHHLSGAMIWLSNGDQPPNKRAIIRAGWTVNPSMFYDDRSRSTIAWSRNGDQNVCTNHMCPGFVQVNPTVLLGGSIWPVSIYRGYRRYMYYHIYKDEKNNWWLAHGNLTNTIGYWPAEIFTDFDHANEVDFGGVVACPKDEDCPLMGNGHEWNNEGTAACMFRRVQSVGPDHKWGGLGITHSHDNVTDRECYSVGEYYMDTGTYNFAFGGPVCPAFHS